MHWFNVKCVSKFVLMFIKSDFGFVLCWFIYLKLVHLALISIHFCFKGNFIFWELMIIFNRETERFLKKNWKFLWLNFWT